MTQAITLATGQVKVGKTAVKVLDANVDRRSLLMKIVFKGEVFLGFDNTLTAENGHLWESADGAWTDSVPYDGEIWAIQRDGLTSHSVIISYAELSDA